MNKRGKIILVSSAMAVVIIAVTVFFLIIKPSQSAISPLGFATLAEKIGYSKEKGISDLDEAKALCNLKCPDSKAGINLELRIMVCNCNNEQYILDTKTLQFLTLKDVEERAYPYS